MTTAALPREISYMEDGVSLDFPIPFAFRSTSDIRAERRLGGLVGVPLLPAQFSVTGAGTPAGGTLTLAASVAGARLTIWSETVRGQQTDYDVNDTFPAESHEAALDRLDLVTQDIDRELGRTMRAPRGEAGPAIEPLADRAGRMALWSADGQTLVSAPIPAGDALLTSFKHARIPGAVWTTHAEVASRRKSIMDAVSLSDKALLYAGATNVDLTYAYRTVMGSSQDYSTDLHGEFDAPPFPHALSDTIPIRPGQHLFGPGRGAAVSMLGATPGHDVLLMGMDLQGDYDPHGPPCTLANFRTHAGPTGAAVVRIEAAGAQVSDMFISVSDTGIALGRASDGSVSDIIFDLGGRSIFFDPRGTGIRNMTLNGIETVAPFIAVAYGGRTFDTTFNGCVFAFSKSVDIHVLPGSDGGRNIAFNGCLWPHNQHDEDWENFTAWLILDGNAPGLTFNGGAVNKWKNALILDRFGNGGTVRYNKMVFDGAPSDPVNYSTTANTTGYIGSIRRVRSHLFTDCDFANIPAGGLTLADGEDGTPWDGTVEIRGGSVRDCAFDTFLSHEGTSPYNQVTIRDLDGDDSNQLLEVAPGGRGFIRADGNERWNDEREIESATTIRLPRVQAVRKTYYAYVTGTETITGISPDPSLQGARVVLRFDGPATLAPGANLGLAAPQLMARHDTFEFYSDDGQYFFPLGMGDGADPVGLPDEGEPLGEGQFDFSNADNSGLVALLEEV